MPEIDSGGNVIEAAANGITDGLKLAVNVGAMLIGFIALIAVLDVGLNWIDSLIDGGLLNGEWVTYGSGGMSPVVGEYAGVIPGSLQTLFGTLLRPLAWLMGVPWADAALVGNLLGIKISLNELVAYGQLGSYIQEGAISSRAADHLDLRTLWIRQLLVDRYPDRWDCCDRSAAAWRPCQPRSQGDARWRDRVVADAPPLPDFCCNLCSVKGASCDLWEF